MVNYRYSEDNACFKAWELLDSLSSHPGSEYQFAAGCIDVFREFFGSFGVKRTISNPLFIRLYQNYQQVMEGYRGKIDLTKIERSFNSTLEHNGVNFDDLVHSVSLQKSILEKTTIKGSNGNQDSASYTFTGEYAIKLDEERRNKERRARESAQKNGRKTVIEIVEEEALDIEERNAIKKIRKENYTYVYTSLARVKGLHDILSKIYEESKLSDKGEFNPRFIESWLDFRREIVFLREWLDYNRGIGFFARADQKARQKAHQMLLDKVVENIDKYKGSPQQLFEKSRSVSFFPQLESIFEEIDSQVGELV